MRHLPFPLKTLPLFILPALICGLSSSWAFSILEPSPAVTYHPGQRIPIILALGEVPGVTKVHYFWYGEDEDMLKELVEQKLILAASAKSTPPFGGTIAIPKDAIGTYRLLAVAEQGGRQSQVELLAIFDEVLLQVEPTAPLLEIDFQTDKPLRLGRAGGSQVYEQVDFLGKTLELPVVGYFADGVTRHIRHHTAGTTYHSANESIVTVNPDGVLRLMGNGATTLTVKNRGQEASLEIQVEVEATPNQSPISNAGTPHTVSAGERVILNGLGSYDPEGQSLQYHWSQVRGSKIPLLDPYSGQPRFLAPLVATDRTFRFKLRVTDAQGADSLPAYVDVLVSP